MILFIGRDLRNHMCLFELEELFLCRNARDDKDYNCKWNEHCTWLLTYIIINWPICMTNASHMSNRKLPKECQFSFAT